MTEKWTFPEVLYSSIIKMLNWHANDCWFRSLPLQSLKGFVLVLRARGNTWTRIQMMFWSNNSSSKVQHANQFCKVSRKICLEKETWVLIIKFWRSIVSEEEESKKIFWNNAPFSPRFLHGIQMIVLSSLFISRRVSTKPQIIKHRWSDWDVTSLGVYFCLGSLGGFSSAFTSNQARSVSM